MHPQDFLQIIKNRRSIRKYEEREIPQEILIDLIDCGRLAPTGYNAQPWVFVVVIDKNLKARIAQLATYGRFIKEAGACIAVFCRKDAVTPLEDACAATENIIIAACAYGLGTCWVNSYRKAHSRKVEALLGCPENMELMTLLAVGHPAEHPSRSKKALNEVLYWERFERGLPS